MAPITPEQAERQLEKDQASGRAFYLEERATGLLAGGGVALPRQPALPGGKPLPGVLCGEAFAAKA